MTRRRGLFINFEGPDGCGKSTQMHILAERLRAEGRMVVETAEPGGTRIGEQIRRILLDSANQELCPVAELLLYFASRAQNVDELILPSLGEGAVVLTDRFTDSSMAYQGFGRGLGEAAVASLDKIACRGLRPEITILIDIDPETSLARAKQRKLSDTETRMDDQALEFHRKVRAAYLHMAGLEPRRFRVIDGRASIEKVAAEVWDAVWPLLERLNV
jgi:dTMP kinase